MRTRQCSVWDVLFLVFFSESEVERCDDVFLLRFVVSVI